MTDYYEVLGVKRTATLATIRKAYRAMAKELHPDLHPDDVAKNEAFKAVVEAYEYLSDDGKRKAHDLLLTAHEGRPKPKAKPPRKPIQLPEITPEQVENWYEFTQRVIGVYESLRKIAR